jgi:hypothetical protein
MICCLLLPAFCVAQKAMEGKIIDRETGKPIPFASVGIVGTSKGTSSNLDGEFSLIAGDSVTVKISCLGYESVTIKKLRPYVEVHMNPSATQLREVVVFQKNVNPERVVRNMFKNVPDNFNSSSFIQSFFYRHYCKDDSVYGRLIEAAVDVWRRTGYKHFQSAAGEREEMRVAQLRRSFDKTALAESHVPIAVRSILEADMAAYQAGQPSQYLSFFSDVSNLRIDSRNYRFTFNGTTTYDGQVVYEIGYQLRKDSVPTRQGHLVMPQSRGKLFIALDSYALLKMEDLKYWNRDTVRTSAYYRQYENRFYPYHLIREAKSIARDNSTHWVHVELMSAEIHTESLETFKGREPNREELLQIPYDSVFWSNHTILKTTPLEDKIILDLGGGKSLNQQFFFYQQRELKKANNVGRKDE